MDTLYYNYIGQIQDCKEGGDDVVYVSGKDKEGTYEKAGTISDFLEIRRGETLSNSKVMHGLIGFAVYLRNKGYNDAKILVTGGDRDKAENERVHGSPTSRHLSSQAADIKVSKISTRDLSELASESGLWGKVVYHSPSSGREHTHVALGRYNRKAEYTFGNYVSWFNPGMHLVEKTVAWDKWIASFPKFY